MKVVRNNPLSFPSASPSSQPQPVFCQTKPTLASNCPSSSPSPPSLSPHPLPPFHQPLSASISYRSQNSKALVRTASLTSFCIG
ncbi:hypothetical protein IE53DRAFT_266714 [Violaceomyces palustris]|uniref:Uncharacterized protein n=1 Tax=Violaceomyces palustris TaxID=1673888 RepID=A0ACD0NMX4_9BASI|nr:hypothetical protein IE53DRAFT_266714 [Violaceomyces palustris]